MSSILYTVGFTRKGAQRFFELLADAGVRLLLDIRARPDSQLAGFARARDLVWLLQKVAGIGYLHVSALAPAADLLADYRDGRFDWAGYERRYLGALNEPLVRKQLIGVELDRACLLCAEPLADQCHRRLAAEWLAARQPGLEIEHLV
ncbi:DUF488 domain-containing protein [Azoarcus sp. PA01]|nr:DUF488 domain-containing protein [Azoarcus sp. PA01]KON82487.1 DUF488 domain-containing protein [Azoarcus sp. PA01]